MREMVLNHASRVAQDRHTLSMQLLDMAGGMVSLNQRGIAGSTLRMSRSVYEISCIGGITFYDAVLDLKKEGDRDKSAHLIQLSTKTPLLDSVSESIKDRFLRCEVTDLDAMKLSPADGEPLLYCAITDGIAVGFHSDPIWEQDRIDVYFNELSTDDEFGEGIETIDNLTRPEHAEAIFERHQAHLRTDISNFNDLWNRRYEVFPNLVFGPDVEGQLGQINPSALSAIVKKLSILDRDAAKWRATNAAMPAWGCRVRPESHSVRNNPSLIEARRFR